MVNVTNTTTPLQNIVLNKILKHMYRPIHTVIPWKTSCKFHLQGLISTEMIQAVHAFGTSVHTYKNPQCYDP